jgi:hypothetical protein
VNDRRFNEEEVAAILKDAAEAQYSNEPLLPSSGGMTLAELQSIGREIGISPDMIQKSAQRFNPARQPTRKLLGLPLAVAQTVEFDRKLTDEEWERIVADLRETFEAPGVVRQQGSLRQWTNGNLQALLEPTATGQRLRMRTVKGNATALILGGIAVFTGGTGLLVTAFATGVGHDTGLIVSILTGMTAGAGMFGSSALRLPEWARRRQQQMDEIAERAALMAKALPDVD